MQRNGDTITIEVSPEIARRYREAGDAARDAVRQVFEPLILAAIDEAQAETADHGAAGTADDANLRPPLLTKTEMERLLDLPPTWEAKQRLLETMRRVSQEAKKRGLTPEILESILNEEPT